LLKVKHLTFTYGIGTPFAKTALDDISLTIEPGQYLGIIGPTGSGKSTLIKHLNGIIKPQTGNVFLDGKDIWSKDVKMNRVRFRVGLVFQYPEYQLFEETVRKDIAFGPKSMGLSEQEIAERVSQALEFVGLTPDLADSSPFDLSGGQKRRVAIAGVIAMHPEFLVLDEPTAGLDPAGRTDILNRISQYRKKTGGAVVLVTHSMEDIARTVDSILVLSRAKTALSGAPSEIFGNRKALQEIGLDVPAVTRVLLYLRDMGLDIDTSGHTVEQAVKILKNYSKGGIPVAF